MQNFGLYLAGFFTQISAMFLPYYSTHFMLLLAHDLKHNLYGNQRGPLPPFISNRKTDWLEFFVLLKITEKCYRIIITENMKYHNEILGSVVI